MWTLLREVSFRHLRHSPFRTALVVFGIALGVCMLSAVLATNRTLIAAFEDMVDRVAGKADLTVAGSDSGIPSALTGEIADIEGVAHAAAMLEVTTRTADQHSGALLVLGVDFLGDTFFLPFAQAGEHQVVEDPLAFANDPTAVLVSKKLAGDRGLKVGDPLPLVTTTGVTNFYVRGILEDEGPASSFGGQVLVMFIDAAQVSFSRGYAVDRIDVVVKEGYAVADVKARIETMLNQRATVEAPHGRAQRLVGALWTFRTGLNMSGGISLGVGMFLIYNAVSIAVAQRRKEVGTLRALGVTRGRMVGLFSLEALVMALFGTAIGLVLAKYLAQYAIASVETTINRFMMPIQAGTPEITPAIALAGVAAGLLATFVAAYFPARAASHVDPAEALRSSRASAHARPVPSAKLAVIGLVLTALAMVPAFLGGELNGYAAAGMLMGSSTCFVPMLVKGLRLMLLRSAEGTLGIPGRVALDNVERSLGRSALTVVALMLAVALSMAIGAYATSFEGSMVTWVEDTFAADAYITAGSPLIDRQHMPFAPTVMEQVRSVQGIEAANPIRNVLLDVKGRRIVLQAMDTRTVFGEAERRGKRRRVAAGPSPIPQTSLFDAPRALVSENFAAALDLKPGSVFSVPTPSGPHDIEVTAVVVDFTSDQGMVLIDRRWFAEYWGDEVVDAVDVYFASGVVHEAAMQTIRERLRAVHGLFVTPNTGLREEMRGAARALFAYAKAPELITLVVAIMGVIGTMLAAVLDRIRDIGVLRAIGATRRQVAVSLVSESAFLGLSASVAGVLVGVPLGWILISVVGKAQSGWSLAYAFPLETALRMSGFVVLAAVVAGFFPGRQAASMDVKEALGYE
jgi:putative ABC transport system permease protein